MGLPFPLAYTSLIAPVYALSTAMGISMQRGYQSRQYTRIKPVFTANAGAFFFVATISFFAKGIAFSRLALVAGFVINCLVLYVIRLVLARKKRPAHLLRRALIVGDTEEAVRLQTSLEALPKPILDLTGYVSDTQPLADEPERSVKWLGSTHQLRDIVRLQEIDDVVFASSRLANRTIFNLIEALKNLPVEFKILSAGQEHLIGQARIDDLNAPPLIDAEKAFGRPRSTFERRAFEVSLVILGLLLHPLMFVLSKIAGRHSWLAALVKKTRQLPSVLNGSKSLIGYREEEHSLIPKSWHLKPGIFTITDTLPIDTRSADDINRAYWLYYSNQSVALDFDIMLRCLDRATEPSS